jgi:hypothetical protein
VTGMLNKEYFIEGVGRREVGLRLTTQQDPAAAILQLQRDLGLQLPHAEPALAFLDLLQVPRSVVYTYLLEHMKDSLIGACCISVKCVSLS